MGKQKPKTTTNKIDQGHKNNSNKVDSSGTGSDYMSKNARGLWSAVVTSGYLMMMIQRSIQNAIQKQTLSDL